MKIVVISASPRKTANTQIVMKFVNEYTKSKNSETKFINLSDGEIECYRGFDVTYNEATKNAAKDIMEADVWIIGSPIYNSFFSSALKNLFEYIDYKKTEGKVAGMIILAAGNIGFVDVQTMITQLLSYFRVITNPKAVYLTTEIFTNNEISDEGAKNRLKEMVNETLQIASKLHK
ncbi:MAG: NAD(P)H-dependent oxidoreductase [Candidatus Nitrosopumilus limneticus]|nr:NAD(P)H-dependent oxidoreductase [Candidatus Nitrosopumilus limneticus]MDC4214484.1 NAD(P)H-dependent oxidoreductase [Candidatus Nitrosopumilus limneticus]MDC4219975.1 NAD(P)H-dependent oxidoreductase [Candidatus Nitrosopumilus limneticus]MDC4221312.1 NAD(P)H-dependent oxidoreductase [Candidatus Nitrosopumilus limneticus]